MLHRLFGGDGTIKTVNELHIAILIGYWELMVQYWVTVCDGAKCRLLEYSHFTLQIFGFKFGKTSI